MGMFPNTSEIMVADGETVDTMEEVTIPVAGPTEILDLVQGVEVQPVSWETVRETRRLWSLWGSTRATCQPTVKCRQPSYSDRHRHHY